MPSGLLLKRAGSLEVDDCSNHSQIASLKDDKVSAEENASKAIALDQLGHIAARMRISTNKAAARERDPASEAISGTQPLTDVSPSLKPPTLSLH